MALLREQGPMTRTQISEALGVARTTVSMATQKLVEQGSLVILGTDAAARLGSGRPAEFLALDPHAAQFMGFDFGHRRVWMAMANASRDVVAREVAEYPDGVSWDARIELAVDLVDKVVSRDGISLGELRSIAVGIPGPVAKHAGEPRLPWAAMDMGAVVTSYFRTRYACPVTVDNNTRLAGLAEAVDAASRNMIYVSLSDGVGGAVVAHGRLITGASGLGGEVGHIRAVQGGDVCRCGRYGCLETVASVPALLKRCTDRGAPCEDLKDLAAYIDAGNHTVERVLVEVGGIIGRTLAGPVTLVNSGHVVVGGRVPTMTPILANAVHDALNQELLSLDEARVNVSTSVLGDDAGALGALAIQHHDSSLMTDYRAQRLGRPTKGGDTTSKEKPIMPATMLQERRANG